MSTWVKAAILRNKNKLYFCYRIKLCQLKTTISSQHTFMMDLNSISSELQVQTISDSLKCDYIFL